MVMRDQPTRLATFQRKIDLPGRGWPWARYRIDSIVCNVRECLERLGLRELSLPLGEAGLHFARQRPMLMRLSAITPSPTHRFMPS
jgi:hypothetical protein